MFSARKLLFLICILLIPRYGALAADKPSPLLKGIKIISYQTIVEKTVGGNGCKIDEDNLNTSLQFIANQSTTLKVISQRERAERDSELWQRSKKLSSEASARLAGLGLDEQISQIQKDEPMRKEVGKAVDENLFMPRLYIGFLPLQTTSECAATIEASLTATVAPTRVRATQTDVYYETIEIWSETYGIVSPQATFSNQATNSAEQMIKKLVNDWTVSQSLFR